MVVFTGLDFGNFQINSVSGIVYNDISGARAAPRRSIPTWRNWTIDLEDTSGNVLATVLEQLHRPIQAFTGLAGGTYLVAEVVQTQLGSTPSRSIRPSTRSPARAA